jgi:hypothetical protein
MRWEALRLRCASSVAVKLEDEQLDRISAELKLASEGQLPILAMASGVALLDTKSSRWKVQEVFKLG